MAKKGAAMASFHLAVKAISRGAGRSATAAAAYRAGVEIEDDRTGLAHDYTRKHGIEPSEIVAPDDVPSWVHDRAALWNAAEAAERRKDAKVAREYEIALPAELDAAQRRDLALGFAREISNRYGVAVDVAIHLPGREGDHRNHHAHLLATTRRIGPEGLGAKTRELDVKATASVEVEQLRQRWANMQNIALEQTGHVERVDHRTLKAQGIEAEPELKQGPAVTAMERKAKQIAQGEGREYQPVTKVAQHNAEVQERRGLRQYIERGTEWLRQAGERVSGRIHDFAASMGGAIERDQRAAEVAEQAIQETERLAVERQRQAEIARREGQERLHVAEKFKDIAAMRELRAFGYADGSDNWRATPETLRKAVDDFNAAKQHTKDRFIERLQREPAIARGVGQLIGQRERALQIDRGISR
jgi:hypothetical protein